MEEQKVSKRKKGTVKKVVLSLLGVVLIVGVTIIGTLAYLSTLSNNKTNTFVGSAGISLALSETKFDDSEEKLYGPGDEIDKNPQLINISEAAKTGDVNAKQEEWVAMVVTYSINDSPATYSALQNVIEPITFDTTNWESLSNTNNSTKYAMYLYNTTIKRNEEPTGVTSQTGITDTLLGNSTAGSYTQPLFSKIKIKAQNGNLVGTYNVSDLPKFEIKVYGAAIKAEYTGTDGSIITSYSGLSTTQQGELTGRLRTLLENQIGDGYKAAD